MSRNATELSSAQETTIRELVAGRTITDAAAEAGVDRATIHRWKRTDSAFIAALNAERKTLREAARLRLLTLVGQAVDTVGGAIAAGDVKCSLEVLKGLGIFDPEPDDIGSDSPAEVEAELGERAMRTAMRL